MTKAKRSFSFFNGHAVMQCTYYRRGLVGTRLYIYIYTHYTGLKNPHNMQKRLFMSYDETLLR